MTDFEIIPESERPARIHVGTKPTALTLALESGQTVFVAHATHPQASSLRQPHSYLRKRGLTVVARAAERGGVQGLVMWTERQEVTDD